MKDGDLLLAITGRDTRALEAMYERYAPSVYSLAFRMLRDRALAEEATQEAFLAVWRKPRSYVATRATFLTWLLGVTHRHCIDELRRRAAGLSPAGAPALVDEPADDRLGPVEEGWLSQERAAVGSTLAQLSASQRVAIELAYFQGMTQMEIAAQLGEPLDTIKARIRIGMQALRALLEGQGLQAESR